MNIRLGPYDATSQPKRTPLGIEYNIHGLDEYGPRRVKKVAARMEAAEVAQYIIDDFERWATAMPSELPNWLDAAYMARMKDWQACVGHRLSNGTLIDLATLDSLLPEKVKIIFHPHAFPVPQRDNVLTDGAAYMDRIEVAIVSLESNNTWLRKGDVLVEWELGNWIARQFGFSPQDDRLEIGNKRPC